MEYCRVAQKLYMAYLKLLYSFPLLFYVQSKYTNTTNYKTLILLHVTKPECSVTCWPNFSSLFWRSFGAKKSYKTYVNSKPFSSSANFDPNHIQMCMILRRRMSFNLHVMILTVLGILSLRRSKIHIK